MHRSVIRFDPEALESMKKEALVAADGLETGGILLGWDNTTTSDICVSVAGGPGPHAQRRADFFWRDLAYAVRLGNEAYVRDGSVWVGEWHTHPRSLLRPSRRDLRTYRGFLEDPALEFEHFASVIVTSAAGWKNLVCTGWVIALPPGGQGRLRVRSALVEGGNVNGEVGHE
jgi:integrative and conjugative element protein (TIGR02256 family)